MELLADVSLSYYVYLILMFILSVLVVVFSKKRWINRRSESDDTIADVTGNSKKNKGLGELVISRISEFLLVLLILDEVGLLFQEWGVSAGLFAYIRDLMQLPGVSQALLLANFGIILPSVFTITSQLISQIKLDHCSEIQLWADFEFFRKKISILYSLFVFCISLTVFILQCIYTNEISNIDGTGINTFSILVLFIGPVAAMLIVNKQISLCQEKYNPYYRQPWFEKELLFLILLVCFLSLTQTIITKVILLLSLISSTQKTLAKWLNKIRKNLLSPVITKVGFDSIVRNLLKANYLQKWNYIFLTSSFCPLILLFQAHSSPYPPTDSAFPKSETISMLYMLYMLIYLTISNRNKATLLGTTIVWTILTVFILYLTPTLFPSWYFPSVNPNSNSPLEIFAVMTTVPAACLVFFLLHLFCALALLSLYYTLTLKNEVFTSKVVDTQKFKKYFFLKSYNESFLYFMPLLLSSFAHLSSLYSKLKITDYEKWENLELTMYGVFFLYSIFLTSVIPNKVRDIKKEVVAYGGEELLVHINKLPLISEFKELNLRRTTIIGYLFYFIPSIIFISTLIIIHIVT